MKKSHIISALLVILLSIAGTQKSYSQDQSEARLKTMFAYTISNFDDLDQLDEFKSEIEELNFVEKVKINYKSEKSDKAQMIIFINEPQRTSENQIMFEPTSLKKIIISENIELLDLSISKY